MVKLSQRMYIGKAHITISLGGERLSEQEREMKARGKRRFEKKVRRAKEQSSYGQFVPAGRALSAVLADRCFDSLTADLESELGGRQQQENRIIRYLDIRKCCGIAATVMVNQTISPVKTIHSKTVVRAIGKAIHEELYFESFKEEFGSLYLDIVKLRNQDELFGTTKLKKFLLKKLKDTEYEPWTLNLQARVGAKMLTHLMGSQDLFEEEAVLRKEPEARDRPPHQEAARHAPSPGCQGGHE